MSRRRRRERDADPVQRRLAGHPVRARQPPPDGDARRPCSTSLAGVIGLILLATHGSTALLVIGVVGFIVSLGYTAPPLKFVYRGLGEIAVALGFGPLMLLGAYVVQTGGALAWEPFVASIPVALLVALILYVNEIPDRRGDARAGKRTLPVRFSRDDGHHRLQRRGRGGLRRRSWPASWSGVLPIPVLLMLLTIPLALQVSRGLDPTTTTRTA